MQIADVTSGDGHSEHDPGGRLPALARTAIVFAAACLIGFVVIQGGAALFDPGYSRARHIFGAAASLVLYVPLVVLARRFLDRRSLASLGVDPLRSAWRPLLVGMATWLVPAAIGVGVVVAAGWAQISLRGSAGALVGVLALRLVLVFIYEALPEELLFRGYLYHNLATVVPRWVAVIGQAVLFTLWGTVIGAAGSLDRIVLFLVFSLVLGLIRVYTGTVWATIGFHLAFQTVAQALGPPEDVVAVTNLETLQMIGFALPFVLGPALAAWALGRAPGWREREADPPGEPASIGRG